MLTIKQHQKLVYVLLFFTVLKVVFSYEVELGTDEAHYAFYGYFLDLSYFDHPPLVGWIMWLSELLLGGMNLFSIRIPPVIISIIFSLVLYRELISRFKFSIDEATAIVFVVNSSFIFFVIGITIIPETILVLMVLLACIYYAKLLDGECETKNYILFGLFVGLCGLSKYTAFLIIPSFFFALIVNWVLCGLSKGLFNSVPKFLLDWRLVLSVIIACVVVSPVLIWNIENDFISFKFQNDHVAGYSDMYLEKFITSIMTALLGFSPFITFLLIVPFIKSVKILKNDSLITIFWFVSFFVIIFFSYTGASNKTLPHWWALAYLFAIPIAFYAAREFNLLRTKKFLVYGGALSSIFLCATLLIIALNYNPIGKDTVIPGWEINGWQDIAKMAEEERVKHNADGINVPIWTLMSRAMYYGVKVGTPINDIYLLDDKFNQFDMWSSRLGQPNVEALKHKNFVFYDVESLKTKVLAEIRCGKIDKIDTLDVKFGGFVVNRANFYLCTDYLDTIDD